MAVREKIFFSNQIYFITFTILGWKHIFTDDKYIDLVYKWFDYMRDNYQNLVYGYVIMPNHVHLILFVSKKSPSVSKLIQNAKRFMAYQIVDLLEKEGKFDLLKFFKKNAKTKKGSKHKIFEDRYNSKIIQSPAFFLEKLNYIHNNPCTKEWNLADNPEKYEHSSVLNYFKGKGVYNIEIMET